MYHDAFQRVASFAEGHNRHAVAQFRFGHRGQVHFLCIALGNPGRHGVRRLHAHEFGRDIRFYGEHTGRSGEFRRLTHRATRGEFEFHATKWREALARELRQIPGTRSPAVHGILQDDAHLFLHRTVMLGGTHAKARLHFVVEVSDRNVGHQSLLLTVGDEPKLSVTCNASKYMGCGYPDNSIFVADDFMARVHGRHAIPEGLTWARPESYPLDEVDDLDKMAYPEHSDIGPNMATLERCQAVTAEPALVAGVFREPCHSPRR